MKGRHQGCRQQQDQPGCVGGDPGGEACQGDQVLRLAQQQADQAGAAAGLPSGTVELVLGLAVLEIAQVQRGGVLHQAQAGFVAEPVGQQLVQQRHRPAERIRQQRQQQLGAQQQAQPP